MQEIITKAIVLDRIDTGENNSQVILYTQELGLIKANAKSSRSVKSKLSAHIEPLNLIVVRLVRKNQFTITDALSEKNYLNLILKNKQTEKNKITYIQEMLAIFKLIKNTASVEQPDDELWSLLSQGRVFNKSILKALGFDPAHAICGKCEAPRPGHFLIQESYYLCNKCFKNRSTERIVIK